MQYILEDSGPEAVVQGKIWFVGRCVGNAMRAYMADTREEHAKGNVSSVPHLHMCSPVLVPVLAARDERLF